MATFVVGDTLPKGTFSYVPYTPELENGHLCGVAIKLSTDEWRGKKVILVAVPGAFTPTCHAKHLPPYIEKYNEFIAKGVDVIAVLSWNDAYVMSGWGRLQGVQDKILCLSDGWASWTKSIGLTNDNSGFTRPTRFAAILDDLKVTYLGVEPVPGVTVSGAEAVLENL